MSSLYHKSRNIFGPPLREGWELWRLEGERRYLISRRALSNPWWNWNDNSPSYDQVPKSSMKKKILNPRQPGSVKIDWKANIHPSFQHPCNLEVEIFVRGVDCNTPENRVGEYIFVFLKKKLHSLMHHQHHFKLHLGLTYNLCVCVYVCVLC
jgi:hypothetical protein